MAALRADGLRAARDVSVVGFDEAPSARFREPALTTVECRSASWAAKRSIYCAS